jgi:hypothetical protein
MLKALEWMKAYHVSIFCRATAIFLSPMSTHTITNYLFGLIAYYYTDSTTKRV